MDKALDHGRLEALRAAAEIAPRLRSHWLAHGSHSDSIQRLAVFVALGSYVRPHSHRQQGKWELLLVLSGHGRLLMFEDSGEVRYIHELGMEQTLAVEIPMGACHAVVCSAEEGLLLFEVKPGPYYPMMPEDFAPWSPVEETAESKAFVQWALAADVGQCWSAAL